MACTCSTRTAAALPLGKLCGGKTTSTPLPLAPPPPPACGSGESRTATARATAGAPPPPMLAPPPVLLLLALGAALLPLPPIAANPVANPAPGTALRGPAAATAVAPLPLLRPAKASASPAKAPQRSSCPVAVRTAHTAPSAGSSSSARTPRRSTYSAPATAATRQKACVVTRYGGKRQQVAQESCCQLHRPHAASAACSARPRRPPPGRAPEIHGGGCRQVSLTGRVIPSADTPPPPLTLPPPGRRPACTGEFGYPQMVQDPVFTVLGNVWHRLSVAAQPAHVGAACNGSSERLTQDGVMPPCLTVVQSMLTSC